jgi:Mrp family chromosome partitioning ATPase
VNYLHYINWLKLKSDFIQAQVSGTGIIMNMWEEAYSRNKEYKRVSTNPKADSRLFCSQKQQGRPDSLHHPVAQVSFKTFEEVYYQIKRPQNLNQHSQGPGLQPSPESLNLGLKPRVLFDRLSTPYPEIFPKMHSQLSDIWANIMEQTKQKMKTLLVAGATRKEGNTFVSFYLSLFLSKEYRMKTLYVDTNLNHAAISNMNYLPGLYSFAAEKKELSSLIVQSEYPGLFLLPSGYREIASNVDANFLPRERLEILIDYCRENYDMTIIDGQPLTLCPAMIEFASVVDMTALVCRYGYSRREVSKQAVDMLRKLGVTSIGVILNDCRLPIPRKISRMMG